MDKSEQVRVTVARVDPVENRTEQPRRRKGAQTTAQTPVKGFCIRCGNSIAANAARPYCNRCFTIWNKFKNPEFEEKHCHICGKEHKVTMEKPVCLKCYREHKKWVDSMIGQA